LSFVGRSNDIRCPVANVSAPAAAVTAVAAAVAAAAAVSAGISHPHPPQRPTATAAAA